MFRHEPSGVAPDRITLTNGLDEGIMSLAYPLPTPGQEGIGEPGPVTVPAGELGKLLGTRQVSVVRGRHELALIDTPLEG